MEASTGTIGRQNKLKRQHFLATCFLPCNKVQTSKHTHTQKTTRIHKYNTMPPAKNSLGAEGDVSVQKVKKIEHVYDYDLVTRPWVFAIPRVVTVLARPPPGAGVSVSDQKKVFQRALSEQDIINDYIATKKKQFAGEIPQGGAWYT